MYDVNVVLAGLKDFDMYDRIRSSVRPEWFPASYRDIYEAIRICHDQDEGRVLPWKDLRITLKGKKGAEKIADVVRKSKNASKAITHRTISRFLYENMLGDLLEEMASDRESNQSINYDQYIKKLEDAHRASSLKVDRVDFLERDLTDWIEAIQSVPVVPYPFPALNAALDGGAQAGHITTVLARTDGGKTSFAVVLGAHALKHGLNIAHCSQETPEMELGQRYNCALTGHSWPWILSHPKTTRRVLRDVRKQRGNLSIADFSGTEATTADIRVACDQAIRAFGGLDLLIVDAGDDVRSTRKMEKKTDECRAVWVEIRRLCKRYNCAGLITTQANRLGAGADSVELVHIGEAWGKATASSEILVLDIPRDKNKGLLIVKKTKRKGEYPSVPIVFERAKCVMREL